MNQDYKVNSQQHFIKTTKKKQKQKQKKEKQILQFEIHSIGKENIDHPLMHNAYSIRSAFPYTAHRLRLNILRNYYSSSKLQDCNKIYIHSIKLIKN